MLSKPARSAPYELRKPRSSDSIASCLHTLPSRYTCMNGASCATPAVKLHDESCLLRLRQTNRDSAWRVEILSSMWMMKWWLL